MGVLTGLAVQGGISLAGGIYNHFSNNDLADMRRAVIEERRGHVARLSRQSRGEFTPQEVRGIESRSEPALNAIQGNLAQRGLSQSGAGGQIIAGAVQQSFANAQDRAAAQLPGAQAAEESALLNFGDDGDEEFFGLLGSIAESYALLQGLNQLDDDGGLLSAAIGLIHSGGAQSPMRQPVPGNTNLLGDAARAIGGR